MKNYREELERLSDAELEELSDLIEEIEDERAAMADEESDEDEDREDADPEEDPEPEEEEEPIQEDDLKDI